MGSPSSRSTCACRLVDEPAVRAEITGVDPHRVERRLRDRREAGIGLHRRIGVVAVVRGITATELEILARPRVLVHRRDRCLEPGRDRCRRRGQLAIESALVRKPELKYDFGIFLSGMNRVGNNGPTK